MIKAIETQYKGYRFRSRLEARWAVFFDALGVKWEYEKEGFDLGDGIRYLPDFWLPEYNCWFEIKCSDKLTEMVPDNVYVAGKIDKWRDALDLNGHYYHGPEIWKPHCQIQHGQDRDCHTILNTCLNYINEADIVFAWIDETDCYGTLAEIGYAKALRKDIRIGFSDSLMAEMEFNTHHFDDPNRESHELWFIEHMACRTGKYESAQDAANNLLPKLSTDCTKIAKLSHDKPIYVAFGGYWSIHEEFRCALIDGGYCRSWELPEWLDVDVFTDDGMNALKAARSARFEHGECG